MHMAHSSWQPRCTQRHSCQARRRIRSPTRMSHLECHRNRVRRLAGQLNLRTARRFTWRARCQSPSLRRLDKVVAHTCRGRSRRRLREDGRDQCHRWRPSSLQSFKLVASWVARARQRRRHRGRAPYAGCFGTSYPQRGDWCSDRVTVRCHAGRPGHRDTCDSEVSLMSDEPGPVLRLEITRLRTRRGTRPTSIHDRGSGIGHAHAASVPRRVRSATDGARLCGSITLLTLII